MKRVTKSGLLLSKLITDGWPSNISDPDPPPPPSPSPHLIPFWVVKNATEGVVFLSYEIIKEFPLSHPGMPKMKLL